MTVIALGKSGPFDKRLSAARHALKSWKYRLVKSRAIIVHENQTNAFAIVDVTSGEVVAGESVEKPRLSLREVEDWFNAQNFVAKVASDGTHLRDVSPATMTTAQREIVARIAMLPEGERLELMRYLSAQLVVA
jgi:uncharacterized protein with WD repeat